MSEQLPHLMTMPFDDGHGHARLADHLVRLGIARQQEDHPLDALAYFAQALDLIGDHETATRQAVAILERTRTTRFNPILARVAQRCLLSPWANYDALSSLTAEQLRLRYGPDTDPMLMALDPLLHLYLTRTINTDPEFERTLVALRRQLASQLTVEPLLDLAAALALQCFANEYIWPETPEETALVKQAAGASLPQDAAALFQYALYRPPADLPALRAAPLEAWPESGWSLQARTIAAINEEITFARRLPSLTPIADDTSVQVRAMYESTPYPRWLPSTLAAPSDPGDFLRRLFPWRSDLEAPATMEILIPGAGTGRHPVQMAERFPGAQVTAVDISRTSLAYGARVADQLGLEKINFIQGDILDLPGQSARYDWIESLGVLHHMADPAAGFRALVECLRPGGYLRIMVYAQAHRREIEKFKADRSDWREIGTSPDAMRRLREDIRNQSSPDYARLHADLAGRPDFYSMSGFRDLLLHVSEQSFNVAGIRAMLSSATDVDFIGFEFQHRRLAGGVATAPKEQQCYCADFPADLQRADLGNWETLESNGKIRFSNFIFWCRRQ